jgi:FAD/FMN-containing dehydrogenase
MTMHRRRFLHLAGVASAGLLSGCGGGTATPPTTQPTPVPPPTDADWRALASSLSGSLVRPDSASYDMARVVFNSRFDSVRPQAVAQCRSTDDVRTVLAFVRRFNLAVTPRSGGHGYAGYSTGTGVVIDVSPLASIQTEGDTAIIGAGAKLIDVYDQLIARGVCIPAGSCPTVGIAGITMGGGVGFLDRAHGLTCDNLISAEVVTADGRVLVGDATQHADLFWALRGGGGGNFGIVTSLTFRTHATRDVEFFDLGWDFAEARNVFAAWQDWARGLPDEVWANMVFWIPPAPGDISLSVAGLSFGSGDSLRQSLDAFVAGTGAAPLYRNQTTTDYRDLLVGGAGCPTSKVSECHLPGQTPDGLLQRSAFAASSDIFDAWLPEAGIDAMVAALRARQANGGTGGVLMDLMGGAVNRVAADATAFVHRSAAFTAQYYAPFPVGTADSVVDDAQAWAHGMRGVMQPWSSGGAYQNYIDAAITDWRTAYYGSNYTRLVQVKAAYDPDGVFRLPQGIPPR